MSVTLMYLPLGASLPKQHLVSLDCLYFLLIATGGSCHTIARKGVFFLFLIILFIFKENQLYISRAEIIIII